MLWNMTIMNVGLTHKVLSHALLATPLSQLYQRLPDGSHDRKDEMIAGEALTFFIFTSMK